MQAVITNLTVIRRIPVRPKRGQERSVFKPESDQTTVDDLVFVGTRLRERSSESVDGP